MTAPLAAIAPSAYWYLARGTGAVALVLLTASVVLGVLGSLRFSSGRWPRFAVDRLHRDVSMLVIVLLVLHIAASVLDGFAPIALTDAVIPFVSSYRPLWLGLGALSFDILLALVLTSLLRRRFGYRSWRAVHWLAYASWPVAVLHGLGTGSDTKIWWMLALTAGCVAAVLVAVLVRIGRALPRPAGLRVPAVALSLATPIGLAGFTVAGPLAHGWAQRAGTPTSLLGKHYVTPAPIVRRRSPAPAATRRSFSATVSGTVRQIPEPGGAVVDLKLRLSGGDRGRLRVRLAGAPIASGGLSLTGSQVDLVADGVPSVMQGKIVSLQGEEFVAHLLSSSGQALELHARLHIDTRTDLVSGDVTVAPPGAAP